MFPGGSRGLPPSSLTPYHSADCRVSLRAMTAAVWSTVRLCAVESVPAGGGKGVGGRGRAMGY
jgi:hypothetical protein